MENFSIPIEENEQLNHTVSKENPHNVTKSQVDLGNVENYSVASEVEAVEGLVDDKYMTPVKVRQAFESFLENGMVRIKSGVELVQDVVSVLVDENNQKVIPIPFEGFNKNLHSFELRVGGVPFYHERYDIVDNTVVLKDNENGLTLGKRVDFVFCYLEQVGSINLPINGVNIKNGSVTKEKLALDLVEFIDSRAEAGHTHTVSDITDISFEHTHTKEDIGLGQVQNYPIASQTEAQDGVLNNRYMTPLRTYEFLETKGLGSACVNVSNSDLNILKQTGFYIGASLTNSPTTKDVNNWFSITVLRHNENYVTQTAMGYGINGNPQMMYYRVMNNSIWSEWECLVTKRYVDEQIQTLTERIERLEA